MTHHVTYQFDDHVIDHVTDHDTLQNIKIKQRFENFGFLESFEKFPKTNLETLWNLEHERIRLFH